MYKITKFILMYFLLLMSLAVLDYIFEGKSWNFWSLYNVSFALFMTLFLAFLDSYIKEIPGVSIFSSADNFEKIEGMIKKLDHVKKRDSEKELTYIRKISRFKRSIIKIRRHQNNIELRVPKSLHEPFLQFRLKYRN